MNIHQEDGESYFYFNPDDVSVLREAFRGDVNEFVDGDPDGDFDKQRVVLNLKKILPSLPEDDPFGVNIEGLESGWTIAAYLIGNIAVFSEYPTDAISGQQAKRLVDEIASETAIFISENTTLEVPQSF